jgi:hypothetical protein
MLIKFETDVVTRDGVSAPVQSQLGTIPTTKIIPTSKNKVGGREVSIVLLESETYTRNALSEVWFLVRKIRIARLKVEQAANAPRKAREGDIIPMTTWTELR